MTSWSRRGLALVGGVLWALTGAGLDARDDPTGPLGDIVGGVLNPVVDDVVDPLVGDVVDPLADDVVEPILEPVVEPLYPSLPDRTPSLRNPGGTADDRPARPPVQLPPSGTPADPAGVVVEDWGAAYAMPPGRRAVEVTVAAARIVPDRGRVPWSLPLMARPHVVPGSGAASSSGSSTAGPPGIEGVVGGTTITPACRGCVVAARDERQPGRAVVRGPPPPESFLINPRPCQRLTRKDHP